MHRGARPGALEALWVVCALFAPGCGDRGPLDRDAAPPDGGPRYDAGDGMSDAGPMTTAVCTPPALLVDTRAPAAVVGTGVASSCTESALDAALTVGGVVTFHCGAGPHTIFVRAEKRITRDTVLDGGGRVTLSGGGVTRILSLSAPADSVSPRLTLQRLTLQAGRADGAGGAVLRLGGSLTVIDCAFLDNVASIDGLEMSGGAIYARGGGATTIVGSTFAGNRASNGGAVGVYDSALTLVNSVVRANAATGMDDAPGQAGSGGGVIVDGPGHGVSVCGTIISDNQANTYGGGMLVFARDGRGQVVFDRATIRGNQIPNHSPSKAGGLFLEGMPVTITATTIAGNQARSDGGMFLGPGVALAMTNTTIADNTALSSLAGGISMAPGVTGTIRNCTLAANRAPGPLAFAGAIVGGSEVLLANTIVWGSEVGHGYAPISCMDALIEGGGNLQWPIERAGEGAGSDIPDAPCSSQVTPADGLLGGLTVHGGPTLTIMPAPDSPARGLGRDCPAVDQRGVARGEPCTSGAVEMPAALRPDPQRPWPQWPLGETRPGRAPHAR